MLTIWKVFDYIYQKLYGEEGKLDEDVEKMDRTDCLEIFCTNGVVINLLCMILCS